MHEALERLIVGIERNRHDHLHDAQLKVVLSLEVLAFRYLKKT